MTGEAPVPEQYRALRAGVGARRLARDVLAVAGPDAAAYLDGQCSQDLSGLEPGGGTWSLVLEPDGKLCALVAVARIADDRFVLATDQGYGDRLAARLTRFKLRTRADIEPLAWSAVGLRGERVGTPVPKGDAVAVPFAVGGWKGCDLVGPDAASSVPDDAVWCDDEAWEACRIESGVPAMGRELDDRTIAQEAGLVPWTVSLTKGCYTGQELVARLDARGANVARRLCAVVPADPAAVDPSALDAATVMFEGRDAGVVTSAAWCPGVGGAAGLAMVRRFAPADSDVELHDRAGVHHRARVVPVPLVSEPA